MNASKRLKNMDSLLSIKWEEAPQKEIFTAIYRIEDTLKHFEYDTGFSSPDVLSKTLELQEIIKKIYPEYFI